MELIANLPFVGGFLSSAIAFVIVLGVVVFVHEYGHYIVGRWCGIKADTFSLGFGPRLLGWVDRRGTKWQVAALPLGGFVKFVGDADGSSRADPGALDHLSPQDYAHSFHGAAVWKRSLTVAAGPVANFILSIVLFGGLALWQGVGTDDPVIGEIASLPGEQVELRPGDRVLSVNGTPIERFGQIYELADEMESAAPLSLEIQRGTDRLNVSAPYPLPPLVSGVEPLSAAAAAGLEPGDYIRSAGGQRLQSFGDLRDTVMNSGGAPLALEVVRGERTIALEITPRETERLNPDGSVETRVMIGVGGEALYYPQSYTPTPWGAVAIGAERTVDVVVQSLTGIKHIILGNLGADNLQGPLGIAQVSGASAEQGALSLIILIAVISTAIGMLNLFPIPVLDGGHLLMFGYEALAGKPPAEAVMRIAMTVGLSLVLLLMLFATYNDLMRLFTS
ncbi:RIP metalloprotease RseP [Halovulum dunhuangense]|uniref:Zinc metalloprotease n=1 Tax=Halovulum dunhuangense TaxID=1505036 RepID=A0A849L3A9_9RHOB|nr:RIP metalloprotease RseP [Halovulum dunhuangense]NNU80710.1 RIP metalloprotease RseP [Halovulum dunhuangense]